MKENAVKFPIPGHILHTTIESSRDYLLRLEAEAAALAGMDSPQARALAQERLEQAEDVREIFEHYASLQTVS